MTTSTNTARTAQVAPARIPCKVWLSKTENGMVDDLCKRGTLSRSAVMRTAIHFTWERTFQTGPGRRAVR